MSTSRMLPPLAEDAAFGSANSEAAVRQCYSQAARKREASLCCPVQYDPELLKAIPEEVLQKDYGCGDPTPYLRLGEAVLDLGAGGGKNCFIASQIVGPHGRVIGVDCNRHMLALARKHQEEVARRVGYANVEFRNGMIQDLRLDLDLLDQKLKSHPIRDTQDWLELRALEDHLRREHPLVQDETVDCVLSNCVLNLVRPEDRRQLFSEMYRVLKRGGRAAISDIVADEDVPEQLRRDPLLWSGCVSGAFREDLFLKAFEDAGFHGVTLVKRQVQPWRVVEGIEFRSVTVLAYKGKQGPCWERNQAVIYRGPFKKVEDDDGHVFFRGERMAVCDKTYKLLQQEPYRGLFEAVEPATQVPLEAAEPFDCRRSVRRHPRETKGEKNRVTTEPVSCCGPKGCC